MSFSFPQHFLGIGGDGGVVGFIREFCIGFCLICFELFFFFFFGWVLVWFVGFCVFALNLKCSSEGQIW